MTAVQIRRARVTEAPLLVDLWLQMMHEHERMDPHIRLTPDADEHYQGYLRHQLLDANAFVIAALQGPDIVGYTLGMICDNLPMFEPQRFGYISDMVVRPDLRGGGVGRLMFERVVDWMRSQGIGCVQLQVYAGNAGGQRFWQRCGLGPYLQRMWMDL